MVCGIAQEQWLAISVAPVVDSQCLPSIDANAQDCCWDFCIVIFGLVQDVNHELCRCDRTLHAFLFCSSLGVVRFCEERVQPLVVEVHPPRVNTPEDAIDGAIVLVQKSQRALVAVRAFHVSHIQHLTQILDVCVHMNAVNTVRRVGRDGLKRHITPVLLDGDGLHILHLLVDVGTGAFVVPGVAHSYLPM